MEPTPDAIPDEIDYLVIGSGFGGSVAAATLAAPGRGVFLLERGKAYPPGSFPRTPDEMAENFWDPSNGLHGLFNVWSFEHVDAIVASGLGGGSLIYANVMLEKPEAWFTQPMAGGHGDEVWSFTHADLVEHYEAVRRVLHVDELPEEFVADHSPKTSRFLDASEGMGRYAPLAVRFRNAAGDPAVGAALDPEPYGSIFGTPRRTTCRMVGECDIGCNEGAKSSMDHTFVSQAHAGGATVYTRTEVRSLRRLDDADQPYRFEVSYVVHPPWAEGHVRDTRLVEEHTIKAKRVVLAAGALGSTFLMLKNAETLGLPPNSPVGRRFCDNGDLLGLASPRRAAQDFAANKGPVITAYREISDESGSEDGVPPVRMYLQDGGVPTIMLWILKTIDAPGLISRLVKDGLGYWWQRVTKGNDNNVSAEASRVMGRSPGIARSLPILAMGEDVPGGRLSLNRDGILTNSWTPKESAAHFNEVRRHMNSLKERLGARFEKNPDKKTERTITVHPLGGCPADTSRVRGVVDSFGRVHGVPGLWIVDGSVMPGPCGANPSLTIAAFARRAAVELLREEVDEPPPPAEPMVLEE
ncbi:GMC family oxidoreductase [Mycobacterium yunnanensis]|uniref:Cholesterol oxidase n=1 Tax=Mycobacterium yunnanensis TaxID=368477 RepID=A0A9X2Z236_9MYCO|nr:GMC family oxidoreductase [Mycobacterium yunnanensis]MCV7422193.1 GMC family oxidoreductase [Mycobacterium yunnanensis]